MEMFYTFCAISLIIIAISFACLRQKFISIIPVSLISFIISGILTSIIGAVVFNQQKDYQTVSTKEYRDNIDKIDPKDSDSYYHLESLGWYSKEDFDSMKKVSNGNYKFSGRVIVKKVREFNDHRKIFPWKMSYDEDQYTIKYLLLNDSVYKALVGNGK